METTFGIAGDVIETKGRKQTLAVVLLGCVKLQKCAEVLIFFHISPFYCLFMYVFVRLNDLM